MPNPFSRIRAWLTGSTASRSYNAAAGGRRWNASQSMPNSLAAIAAARAPIAGRARYAAANNPLGASGVEAWVSSLVGTGIKPQAKHSDPDIRAALNANFETWTDDAHDEGQMNFYGIQAMMARRLVIDGEAFALLMTTANGLRVRLLDPEQVDASYTAPLAGGGYIRQGIEFDGQGQRTAYHILSQTPGLEFSVMRDRQRIPAEDVIHLFKPEVPGQIRGISWFAPVLLRMSDLDSWRDAQLIRQKVAAMLAGFITTTDGSGAPFEGTQHGAGLVGGLEPGTMKFLDPGQDIKFSQPANVGAEVISFAGITEREIAVGLGLPASTLTGDLSQVNYSSIRAGLVEFRRRVETLQHGVLVFKALRPIWQRWATIEVLSGRVQTTVAEALPANWITPKNHWVDPAKDIDAELAAIAGGLMSRREAVASRGVDIEALDAEIAADNTRATKLGLTFAAPANDNNPPPAAQDAA